MDQIILAIISALGGGILAQVFNFLIEKRKSKATESFSLIQHLQEEITRQEIKLQALEQENKELAARIKVLENTNDDIPVPLWHKDLSGTFLWVNNAYVDQFLLPFGLSRIDVIGSKSSEVFEGATLQASNFIDTFPKTSNTQVDLISIDLIDPRSTIAYVICRYPIYSHKSHVGWAYMAIRNTLATPKGLH